ncbi:MAG: hypothetical protein QOI10_1075 [Solirubrobacterales bacterium]|jgi:uncharacterized membrane protein|nr:hypothetical protein [Solirubrobacterales bacterium]
MGGSRIRLAAFWVFAGIMHFVRTREYEAIVPDYVPMSAQDAVRWSGVAEIAGGLMAAPAPTRRLARWWLIGVLIAVFPANVHMALEPDQVEDRGAPIKGLPRWLLWARLPIQPLFALWIWSATE